MRRLLLVAVAALAFPAVAHAKEVTGLELCGPDGCKTTTVTGFGHDDPLAGWNFAGPAPTTFYRLELQMDQGAGGWPVYYEPKSGLVAFKQGNSTFLTWGRLDPALASLVKDLAKRVDPFPTPSVTEVRIGTDRRITENAGSYLRLFAVKGPYDVPRSDDIDVIRLAGSVESPWTDGILLYYPRENILAVGPTSYVRVPTSVAADIEATRPLGDGGTAGSPRLGVPWVVVGIVAAFAGALVIALMRKRVRPPALAVASSG